MSSHVSRRPLLIFSPPDAVDLFVDRYGKETEFIPAADAHDSGSGLPHTCTYVRMYSM